MFPVILIWRDFILISIFISIKFALFAKLLSLFWNQDLTSFLLLIAVRRSTEEIFIWISPHTLHLWFSFSINLRIRSDMGYPDSSKLISKFLKPIYLLIYNAHCNCFSIFMDSYIIGYQMGRFYSFFEWF